MAEGDKRDQESKIPQPLDLRTHVTFAEASRAPSALPTSAMLALGGEPRAPDPLSLVLLRRNAARGCFHRKRED